LTAISKALTILELSGGEEPLSVAALMEATGLPRSTLMRIVGELLARQFLERADRGRYRPGLAVRSLAFSSNNDSAVTARARAELKRLVDATGETAHYAMYDAGASVYVDKVDGLHPVRSYTRIGGRSPSYATATGKALLAWQPAAEIKRVAHKAAAFNALTHVTLEAIENDARLVRARGYAINRGEWREGVWGIAAPIFGPDGNVIAAFGLSGPEARIRPRLKDYTALVLQHAARISAPPPAALAKRSS